MEARVYPNLETKVYPKTDDIVYPNFEAMCRLCLKENAGTISLFTKEKSLGKCTVLSIPIRIMTCAALEVHHSDDFPHKICSECRLQLEKSYYFRKMSQAADAKLRKHLRLISMGKTSKVFDKNLDEDDDEHEFQDSLDFIKEQEELQKQNEKMKMDSFINEMKLQNEQDLKKVRANLQIRCREELTPIIREEMRKELRPEIQKELEENVRKEVTEKCISEAKESLRSEVREECRKLEVECLLDDLQTYLTNKKKSLEVPLSSKVNVLKRPFSPVTNEDQTPKKSIVKCTSKEDVSMELELHDVNVEKENITENITEDNNVNTNEEECDSEGNFLIYNVDEDFDVKKESLENKYVYEGNDVADAEYEDEEFTDTNIITYEKIEDNVYTNDESGETMSTTSYQIEDNEDGEIQFLKKSNDDDDDDDENNVVEEENPDPTNDDIMVINVAEGIENEYEEIEKVKRVKARKKSSTKTKRSPDTKKQTSTVTTTTSTSAITFLTKTYVNPLQRSTDTAKVFKCDGCPMVFSTKLSLERHFRTHRKVEKTGVIFQCSQCRIVVSCNSALRRHMYVHYDEKPFACTVCGKSFVQKEILKRHMQTHTGIKPHQCPHCERSFAQRINLTQHINRTHLKEPRIQQHPCYLCPKRFNHASGLSRHLATHSGVAFQCSECDRTFSDRSSIKRHISSIHSNARSSKDDTRSKTDLCI